MQQTTQPYISLIHEKLEILTIARELWMQAGRPPGQLGDFWETAQQQFISGHNTITAPLMPSAQPEN